MNKQFVGPPKPKLPPAIRARARFFVRVGQAGTSAKVYDEYTRPLFTLPMILECEGLLWAR